MSFVCFESLEQDLCEIKQKSVLLTETCWTKLCTEKQ